MRTAVKCMDATTSWAIEADTDHALKIGFPGCLAFDCKVCSAV